MTRDYLEDWTEDDERASAADRDYDESRGVPMTCLDCRARYEAATWQDRASCPYCYSSDVRRNATVVGHFGTTKVPHKRAE